MFVPRERADRRVPARVSPGAFTARGLDVPADPSQINVYRLTGCHGLPWTCAIDRHVATRGAELLGGGQAVCVDVDVRAAVDGTPLTQPIRWLADRAAEAGQLLDLSATIVVKTPGHPESGHLSGWHIWYRLDGAVQYGRLPRMRDVEIKGRATCPGSPGYIVQHDVPDLPVIPAWLAALAPPPRAVPRLISGNASNGTAIDPITTILAELEGTTTGRSCALFSAASRIGWYVGAGRISAGDATTALMDAARTCGYRHGEAEASRHIRNGLRLGADRAARR